MPKLETSAVWTPEFLLTKEPELQGNVMLLTELNGEQSDLARLRQENTALRSRLSRLSDASLRISESLDTNAVLQEVIDSARSLTRAQYGVLLIYSDTGQVTDSYTSGITSVQAELLTTPPEGTGLLGYLSELKWPLRLQNIASHPMSVGFPKNHPPMKTFLGMPIYHHNVHVGNIFLTEKEAEEEFTSEDEEIITLFASQAAAAIYIARRYEDERSAKNDLETIIDISPVGVMVIDARTAQLKALNAEAMRIIGDLGVVDMTFTEVSLTDFANQVTLCRSDGTEVPLGQDPMARVLQSGEIVRAEEIVVYRADGKSISTLVNAAPIRSEDGQIASVVVAFQDMEPLAELERLRSEFLGLVSHELRTPLSTIKGSTSALLTIADSLNQTEPLQLLRIIDQQADLMRSQINSLIELTHIEAGTLPVTLEAIDVAELVEDASKEFWRGNLGTFTWDISVDTPRISADRMRISQVLKNLLTAAARHSPEDAAIRVTASRDDVYVSISVSTDAGRLLSSDPQHLFEKLRNIHPQDTASADVGSDGLAMAICKGIVEVHGGRIKVERGEHGRGITFAFTVPVANEPVEIPADNQHLPTAGHGSPEIKNARILIAIKETRTLGAIRRALSHAGFSTHATYTVSEIDRIVVDEKPSLVILDMTDPSSEYFHILDRISSGSGLPVLCLCKEGDEETVVRAFDMGVDGYITPPLSPTELVAKVKATLRNRAAFRQAQAPQGYRLGNLAISYAARTVTVGGDQIQLTATEYKLLLELSSSAGRILTQDELLQRVWGPEYVGESQLLRSYVKSLRQKIRDNARQPTHIFTEHGIGYRMAKP